MTQVFVLCTGRCGSTTFARACEHAINFTAKHESRTHLLGTNRFAYPRNHIEVDNRLAWWTGKLHQQFGDRPYYVHLKRDRASVVSSYVGRKGYGLIKAYRETMLCNLVLRKPNTDLTEIAEDMIDTITSNIEFFLRDKTKVMTMNVETMDTDFPAFWDWIGATGDLDAAMAEWHTRHNATE